MRLRNIILKGLNASIGRYLDFWWEEKTKGWKLAIGDSSINASTAARGQYKYLWDAEVSVFSQNGEDGILNYICDKLELGKPSVIEIGAGNFTECNSRYLAEHRSANVLAVDSRTDLESTVSKLFVYAKTNLLTRTCWVTTENINFLIESAKIEFGDVDIFSLDLDGNDYWVLEAADLSGIKVIVVEFNPLLSKTLPVSVPKDEKFDRTMKHSSWVYYGANLYAFIYLLEQRDFIFIGTTRHGSNAFFIEKSHIGRFNLLRDDLELFSDVRARESRGENGELTFTSADKRQSLIADQPVVIVSTGKVVKISECWQ